MKQLATLFTIALGCSLLSCSNPRNSQAHLDSLQQVLSSLKVMLPNGWSLTVPGTSTPLGNFPMNLVVSPQGKYMAITHNGEGKQTIVLLNGADGHISDEIEIGKSWFGLVFNDKEDKLYASGGNDNRILIYSIRMVS
jgi:hypothetical protein